MTWLFWWTVQVVSKAAWSVVNDLTVAAIGILLEMLLRSHPSESR